MTTMTKERSFEKLIELRREMRHMNFYTRLGKVEQIVGMIIEVSGLLASIGDVCEIRIPGKPSVLSEVVGFHDSITQIMPYDETDGIGYGNTVYNTGRKLRVRMSDALIGRTVDALGRPIDGLGEVEGGTLLPISGKASNPMHRPEIREPITLGVKAIDGMITLGKVQRIGIFAGSGVGKSTLMGMIARNVTADVNVLALVGERGRELMEFLKKDLGPEGLKRSVVVVATSDNSAMLRNKCAMTATAIAEFFQKQGKNVLLVNNLPVIGDDHGTVYRYVKPDLSQTKYTNSSTAPEEVTITFNYNDGSGNTKTITAFRQQYEFENETEFAVTINDIHFTNAYSSKIIGWAETADGAGATRYIKPYKDMTLYAQWDSLEYRIPARGEQEIQLLQLPQSVTTIKVYDREGPNGPYHVGWNGTLKLTVPEKKVMLISGTVCTESESFDYGDWRYRPNDYLIISDDTGKLTNEYASKYDDDERNGLYYSEKSGTPKSIGQLTTSANKVSLTFVSDGSDNYDGVDLTIKVTDPIFYVNNKEDFIAYAGLKGDVYLNQDIDLGEWNRDDISVNGNFDGNGHTIIYTGSDKCTGLFRNVKSSASVKHLRVSANITTSQSECAGIAYRNEGTISDCHFRGNIRSMSFFSLFNSGVAGNSAIK